MYLHFFTKEMGKKSNPLSFSFSHTPKKQIQFEIRFRGELVSNQQSVIADCDLCNSKSNSVEKYF